MPRTRTRRGALSAVLASLALGCAASTPAPASPAAAAVPQPDPVCRGTVQDRMLVHGVEQVVAKVSVDRRGTADVLEIEAPYLTPDAAREIRAALQDCPWAPPEPGEGARVVTVRIRAR